MRILVLSLNYAPEPTGFAPHSTALAEHLVSAGHDVTVVTGFPFAPRWKRSSDYRGEFVRHEIVGGVHLVRVTHFIPRSPSRTLQRVLMEGTFVSAALFVVLRRLTRRQGIDAIVYIGAQPAIAWLGRLLAAVCRVPFVVNITDLAAQAALDVGIVRSPMVAQALERIEFSAYRSADAAMVLCEAFRQSLVEHGFSRDAIHLIRSPIDVRAIRPIRGNGSFRARNCIEPHEFVVLYSGSLGLKQGLFDVVDAARLLARDCPNVRWVLVGEGETRAELARQIQAAAQESRVLLLPLQPQSEMNEMFAGADVLLLSQLRSVKDTVIPSKLLTYMAAGRPILACVNGSSQGAAIVRESQCGVLIEPESASALAEGVRRLRRVPVARAEMAERARAYAVAHFDSTVVVVAQQQVIENAVRRRSSAVRPGALDAPSSRR